MKVDEVADMDMEVDMVADKRWLTRWRRGNEDSLPIKIIFRVRQMKISIYWQTLHNCCGANFHNFGQISPNHTKLWGLVDQISQFWQVLEGIFHSRLFLKFPRSHFLQQQRILAFAGFTTSLNSNSQIILSLFEAFLNNLTIDQIKHNQLNLSHSPRYLRRCQRIAAATRSVA